MHSEINYFPDRYMVPSLCHASPSVVLSEDEEVDKNSLIYLNVSALVDCIAKKSKF